MKINNNILAYENCIYEPYLKCVGSKNCFECIKQENKIAESWINYIERYIPVTDDEIDFSLDIKE